MKIIVYIASSLRYYSYMLIDTESRGEEIKMTQAIFGVYEGTSNKPSRTIELMVRNEADAEAKAKTLNEELSHVSNNRVALILMVDCHQSAGDMFEAYELAMHSAELRRARKAVGSWYSKAEVKLK